MRSGFENLSSELRAAQRRLSTGHDRPARVRSLRLALATTAIVIAVLVVILLTGAGGRHHAPSHRGRPPTTSARPVASHAAGGWTLPCEERVGTQSPPRSMRVVLGVVALPASPGEPHALQTARSGPRLFAKWGLWVRSGAHFALIVPASLRRRLSMTWGNAGEGNHGSRLIDLGCAAGRARWLNFVGGYWVTHPMCATVIVAADRERRRVRIGIGTPCPGQRPPVLASLR